uniref:LRIM1/APL1C-like dimerization domain-containing protein n=1 Tax=Anopheles christyi TaxID=43041 RepID=A0A9I3A6V3_9DIPT
MLQVCKVTILLVCVAATVHGGIHEIKQNGSKYKIEKVTDSSVRQALESIRRSASNVKELDLSGNPLSQISAADLAPFTNLELLNLSSNVLYETLDLQSLSKLRTLDLNNNYVQEVRVGPALQTLHAANNNISRVICQGQGWEKKMIYLMNNKISSLLDLSNGCRRRVQHLDLKLNEIDTINFGDLADSSDSLQSLILEYNFIFDIKNQGRVVFSQLQTLDLSWNKLAFMGAELNAASGVTSINLNHNKLVLIDADVVFSRSLKYIDLRGNGFHCAALRKFFTKNSHAKTIATASVQRATGSSEEQCTGTTLRSGPFCCEDLPAPFADRLIDLKRKEHALYSGHGSEKDRAECEKENNARQRAIEALKQQYSTTIDEATRWKQEKIRLEQNKKTLEEQVANGRRTHDELDEEMKRTAQQMELGGTGAGDQNLLNLLRLIVKRYEDMYIEQQSEQNNAIRDWVMYQQKETQLAEENARLKKLNEEVNLAVASANSTLQELNVREKNLATFLGSASA